MLPLTLTLGGELAITDLYGASSSDTWTILTATGGISGSFDTITTGYEVSLANGDTELVLSLAGAVILGDVNGDGVVDGLDIQPFVDLLTGGGYQAEADINTDEVVDGLDIQPFVDIITGAGGNPVPEPATLGLLAVGGLAALARRRRN